VVIFQTSDEECLALLQKLNYKEQQSMADVHSGASTITGDGESSGASSQQSDTTEGAAMGMTMELKLKLARKNWMR
jgi:hypothetical protein